ncbi:FAD-dependent oxidoreductase [Paenibacillus koleovorans]|uniref:FAD-dependent oxidoreductase n=1 Tax=Paenibacillus koleovorans TaxID=121608 RepID=UPI000FDA111A|nr:FAD-dependent oxidoreductase [Paenibacillus koleovorans]
MNFHYREQGSVAVKSNEDRIEFSDDYDVIVVGLGTAGAISAITAANKGLRVLGLERLNSMGGAGTNGAIVGYYYGSQGGLFESIDEEARELEGIGYTKSRGVNAEVKKYVLERRAIDAGVSVLYECVLIGVYMEGTSVHGVRWIGPNGARQASCRILIDATGDADVCAILGAEMYASGRQLDGKMQPFSQPVIAIRNQLVSPFYCDHGYVDQTSQEDLTRAIIQSACIFKHLPDQFNESMKFLKLAPQLGIREGRFILGEEQVTFADVVADRQSAEPLFYAYSNVDNHAKDIAFESELQQDWAVAASLWGLTVSVPIPLGALVPKGFDNVLVAGRSLAIDHDLAACVRMKRDMQKCGEAAALIAYLALDHRIPVRHVPYDQLRPLLLENGCLRPSNHVGMKDGMSVGEDNTNQKVSWLTSFELIKEGLGGDKSGVAIWSARRLGSAIHGTLKEWLSQTTADQQNLRKNLAFALALHGDEAAIPILRECVRERDPYVPKTSRKYNQVRGYAAIYLLGKLGDVEIVPELLRIMQQREQFINQSTDVEFINHNDEYFFQYFSFSLMALIRIADRHPGIRVQLLETVVPLVEDPDFSILVTMKPSKDMNYDMADTIRNIVSKTAASWESKVGNARSAP